MQLRAARCRAARCPLHAATLRALTCALIASFSRPHFWYICARSASVSQSISPAGAPSRRKSVLRFSRNPDAAEYCCMRMCTCSEPRPDVNSSVDAMYRARRIGLDRSHLGNVPEDFGHELLPLCTHALSCSPYARMHATCSAMREGLSRWLQSRLQSDLRDPAYTVPLTRRQPVRRPRAQDSVGLCSADAQRIGR